MQIKNSIMPVIKVKVWLGMCTGVIDKRKGIAASDNTVLPNTKNSASVISDVIIICFVTFFAENAVVLPKKDQIFPGINRLISDKLHKYDVSRNESA